MSEVNDVFIPTRASSINKKSQEEFTSTVYCSYKKKSVDNEPTKIKKPFKVEKFQEAQPETFNIKQAKHEIFKFGVSNFNAPKKRAAKIELAIKLGAKPPKNRRRNYKKLLEEKKKEQLKKKSVEDFQQLGKNQFGKSTAKGKGFDRKRRKEKNDLLDSYGTVKKSKGKSR